MKQKSDWEEECDEIQAMKLAGKVFGWIVCILTLIIIIKLTL